MRVTLFVTVVLLCLFVFGLVASQSVESRDDSHDMDVDQFTRESRRTGMTTPTAAPTTAPTRTPTPSTRPTRRPSRPMRRPRMSLRDMMPRMDMRITRRMIRLMKEEARLLMRVFRALLTLRMRAMLRMPRDMPLSRWQKALIRRIAFRNMMMMMDVQDDQAAQIATMMEEQQAAEMDNAQPEFNMDEAETETETEHESEAEPELEYETEDIPAHEQDVMIDQQMEDPTLIETEFDIAEPYGYGGYGGYGKKGGYGGYGGYGKKGGYGGYGKKGLGINLNFFGLGKKAPFKKGFI